MAGVAAVTAEAGFGAAKTSAATATHPAMIGARFLCIVVPPKYRLPAADELTSRVGNRFPVAKPR
jgi:hypothetical protein